MNVVVNGVARDVRPGTTVAAVVADASPPATGIAVAVDEVVVTRGEWDRVELHEDARVEILTAMQGG